MRAWTTYLLGKPVYAATSSLIQQTIFLYPKAKQVCRAGSRSDGSEGNPNTFVQ
jgi:hypothetical protein